MTSTREIQAPALHYRLTNEEWVKAVRELKPRERDVLFYLRTLDPFGDREMNVSVRAVARDIGCSPGTVSKALKTLDAKGWIDVEIAVAKVKLKSFHNQGLEESVSPRKHCFPQETAIAPGNSEPESVSSRKQTFPPGNSVSWGKHLEMTGNSRLDEFSTGESFLPKQTNQTLKEQTGKTAIQIGLPTTGNIDSKADFLSTKVEDGIHRIENVCGVVVNPPLKAVIERIGQSEPERLEGRITAVINAYNEQRPIIRNPQAFLSAALQRGFTSNEWKQEHDPSRKPEKQKESNFPPPSAANLADLLCEIQIHCTRLEITTEQALDRFGRPGRSLNQLSDIDLATLRNEITAW